MAGNNPFGNPTMKGMRGFRPKGDPESDEWRSRQKGSASPKRKLAQKISSLKRMNPENVEKGILDIVRNPEASAIQITQVIHEMLDKDLSHRTKVELIGKLIQAHTAIHGIKSKSLNVNVDLTSDKVIERLKDWKAKGAGKIILKEGGDK